MEPVYMRGAFSNFIFFCVNSVFGWLNAVVLALDFVTRYVCFILMAERYMNENPLIYCVRSTM